MFNAVSDAPKTISDDWIATSPPANILKIGKSEIIVIESSLET